MRPKEWYNDNLTDTKQNLNKVNKTILYECMLPDEEDGDCDRG